MPHGSSSGDDFASTDEVKIYKEEGEEENKSSAENLSEEKIGLLTETEQVGAFGGTDQSGRLFVVLITGDYWDVARICLALSWIDTRRIIGLSNNGVFYFHGEDI